ncbi:hypothetical protein RFI_19766, partial [Reticulomyxa filosa]
EEAEAEAEEKEKEKEKEEQSQVSSTQAETSTSTENKKEKENEKEKEVDVVVGDNKQWQQLIGDLIQARQQSLRLIQNTTQVEIPIHFKDVVIQGLIHELKHRRSDLMAIKKMLHFFFPSSNHYIYIYIYIYNVNIPEECEGLLLQVETRHEEQRDKLREAKKQHESSGDETKDIAEMQSREALMEDIATDNKEWQEALKGYIQDALQNDIAKREHQVALDELNARINDLLKLKYIVEQKAKVLQSNNNKKTNKTN